MYVKCYSAHVHGLEGQIIEVEVDISSGLPHFDIVGLPGSALREAKERVRSAIKNSGYSFPNKRITVNLAPADIRKEGSYFDLSIAFAILLADKQISLPKKVKERINEMLIIGELSLDGHVRKSVGILPLVLAAKEKRFKQIYIPSENTYEASAIQEIQSTGVPHLNSFIACLQNNQNFLSDQKTQIDQNTQNLTQQYVNRSMTLQQNEMTANSPTNVERDGEDFADIHGQTHVKRAFEIAACGFHHIMLSGPPGSGKTLLAKSFVSLLPDLSVEEAIEVTKIYSVAGLLTETEQLRRYRSCRAPHHSITTTALTGGGIPLKPGEISLAHYGVLFLDEFLEFKRAVVEALREPLQEGKITINRGHHTYTYPAQFLLILSFNPCPCGYYGYETPQRVCSCTATQIEKYQFKLSGPLFDRIDIHLDVPPVRYEDIAQEDSRKDRMYSSKKMRERIHSGLAFKEERNACAKPNGLLTPKEIKSECKLTKGAKELLRLAFEEGHLSTRSYHKLLKLGRTIADLNETELIDEAAIAEAIQFRSIDRIRFKSY